MLTAFLLGITYDDIERWAITWLPILFLGLLVFLERDEIRAIMAGRRRLATDGDRERLSATA